jgi:hypothetical protein
MVGTSTGYQRLFWIETRPQGEQMQHEEPRQIPKSVSAFGPLLPRSSWAAAQEVAIPHEQSEPTAPVLPSSLLSLEILKMERCQKIPRARTNTTSCMMHGKSMRETSLESESALAFFALNLHPLEMVCLSQQFKTLWSANSPTRQQF